MAKAAGRVSLGFATHTGWAAAIAVSAAKEVLDRRRIAMMPDADPKMPRFVYHAAREMTPDAARRLIAEAEEMSRSAALASLKQLLADLDGDVRAAGVLVGAPAALLPLESVLRSHSLVHTAEGELFRTAVRSACAALKIPVVEVRGRELSAKAAALLDIPVKQLEAHLAGIGRAAGRPWAKDQKDAFLAALLAASG